jgi:hypothetical protein
VEGPVAAKRARSGSTHLMCGSRLWTIAAFVCSGYFAKVAIERARTVNVAWSHDALAITTHAVWVLFMIGLITETRCWKERVFFGLVLANFALASAMGLWDSAPVSLLDQSRLLSASLWVAAALVSFALIFARGEHGKR